MLKEVGFDNIKEFFEGIINGQYSTMKLNGIYNMARRQQENDTVQQGILKRCDEHAGENLTIAVLIDKNNAILSSHEFKKNRTRYIPFIDGKQIYSIGRTVEEGMIIYLCKKLCDDDMRLPAFVARLLLYNPEEDGKL